MRIWNFTVNGFHVNVHHPLSNKQGDVLLRARYGEGGLAGDKPLQVWGIPDTGSFAEKILGRGTLRRAKILRSRLPLQQLVETTESIEQLGRRTASTW